MEVFTYRINLELAHLLLEDKKVPVDFRKTKLIFILRDPRAVMHSKRTLSFCLEKNHCLLPKYLCDDNYRDYIAAKKLQEEYSDQFR
jgi:hypothetical protein